MLAFSLIGVWRLIKIRLMALRIPLWQQSTILYILTVISQRRAYFNEFAAASSIVHSKIYHTWTYLPIWYCWECSMPFMLLLYSMIPLLPKAPGRIERCSIQFLHQSSEKNCQHFFYNNSNFWTAHLPQNERCSYVKQL